MWSEPIISATALFALIALGEVISTLTKARVPMLLTAMVSFLLLKWAGIFPENILDSAILPSLGALAIAPAIMHMGTMMPLSTLKTQWKAVIISLFGIIGSTTMILIIVSLVYDFRIAASGVGPISGGIVALLITIDKLKELDLSYLIVLPALVQGLQGVKNCIAAGIHSIEHGIYLDDEAIEKMKAQGTFLVPTLLAPVSVIEFADELGMSEGSVEKSKEVLEAHTTSFTKAVNAGVKIAMGTDAGVFKHGTNLRELELMVEHGMTPMQAIVASTKTAAECLGYDNEIGTIETDKKADFIIVDDNPLDRIGILKNPDNIKIVGIDGEIVKR
ncbi:amidohydrolase family protein [Staphylococcus cohnii]